MRGAEGWRACWHCERKGGDRVVCELCASYFLKELKSVLIEGRLGREWLVVDMDSLLACLVAYLLGTWTVGRWQQYARCCRCRNSIMNCVS